MQCIKTGAHIYITQYGEYAVCDVHQTAKGTWVLRIAGTSRSPMRDRLNGHVFEVEGWFDRNNERYASSTLLADNIHDFSYVGEPLVQSV